VKERIVVNEQRFGQMMESLCKMLVDSGVGKEDALVGIHRRGVVIARRLSTMIERASGVVPLLGSVDITLYRDDLRSIGPQPVLHSTDLPFDVEGRRIILVDDVIYTGRTVRAALSVLLDYGRPKKVELAVLVDRGNRELPIHPDYAVLKLKTELDEFVEVMVREVDGMDGVKVMTR